MKKFIMAAMLILAPTLASAAEAGTDRPHWSLELKGGALFRDTAGWSRFYGSSYLGEYGGALAYKLRREVEIGVEGSYARAKGKGVQRQVPTGEVTHEQAPLNLFVLVRGVFNENQWLVPYAGGGFTRMFYRDRVTGQAKTQGSANGYHGRAGVQLLLDRLEPETAKGLYRDFGMHHTYFLLEGKYTRAMADTVAAGSVNLGGASCLAGFLFEF